MPHTRAPRRLARFAVALLGATAILTACGSEDGPTHSAGGNTEGYPVIIETAHGDITLKAKPERIVVLTPQYVDVLTALDEQPVATTPGDGATEDGFFSFYEWLDGQYTGAIDTGLITSTIQAVPEAIASYEPDLILGNIWNIPEELYGQLSDIAPTYAGRNPDSATSWEDLLTDVATMTGKEEEADDVISGYEADIATAQERLPGLQGKTFYGGHYLDQVFNLGGGTFYADLGLEPAEGQPLQLAANPPSFSRENIDQLTSDVLVVSVHVDPSGKDELEADPRFAELPAVQNGTVIWLDWQRARASAEPGPQSLAWLREQLISQLEESALNQS